VFSRCLSVCLAALSTVDCGVWSGHACLPHLPELVPEIVADPVYFTCANEGSTNAKRAASLQRLQSGRLLTCWNCLEISSPHNYSPTLPPLRVQIAPPLPPRAPTPARLTWLCPDLATSLSLPAGFPKSYGWNVAQGKQWSSKWYTSFVGNVKAATTKPVLKLTAKHRYILIF